MDLIDRERPPRRVHAVAALGRVVPRLLARQVLRPEWPGAALERPYRVHAARADRVHDLLVPLLRDRHLLEEDAVVQPCRSAPLLQAELAVDLAAVFLNDIRRSYLQVLAEQRDLALADPHVIPPARAAVAALGAGELQPIRVPGGFGRRL